LALKILNDDQELINKKFEKLINGESSKNSKNDDNNKEKVSLMKVHSNIWMMGWGVSIVYMQTLIVYPAVLLHGRISFIRDKSWEVWFVITLFNITDVIFKFLSSRVRLLNKNTATIAVGIR